MTDKLDDPANHEQGCRGADDDAGMAEARIEIYRNQVADKQEDQHRRAEAAVKVNVIDRRQGQRDQRDIHPADCEWNQRQQYRKNDDWHTDEVGGDIAAVAVIGRVLGDLLLQSTHGGLP